MRDLIRPELKNLKPYDVGKRTKGIWLNANESAWETPFNRYPIGTPLPLLKRLAEIYQVNSNQLLLTRGSDEGIDIVVRLFCRAYQDAVIICPPTFAMYRQSATLQGANVIEVPLEENLDYQLDFTKISEKITDEIKIIFLCSPNNPTGKVISSEALCEFVKSVESKAIVVVDEAYIEFTQECSMATFINQFQNLVVLRTLSKAYGLAGLRCGIVIAAAPLIEMLRAVMPPFPFSMLMFNELMKATRNKNLMQMKENITYIKAQREMMQYELSQISVISKVYQSDANFILVKCQNAKKVFDTCLANDIYVRAFDSSQLADSLRISIGLASQNQQLLTILQKMGQS